MTIYNLRVDYIFEQNHHYLILDKEEGISPKELPYIQVKMLQANEIPKLLPIEIEERDAVAKFRYRLDSKRQLHQLLKGQKLGMYECVHLIISIINSLAESQKYMLNQEQYIIHEEYLYIGKDVTDVYLTYVPLENVKNRDLKSELETLFIKIMGSVEEIKGIHVKEIIHYFSTDSFNLSGLKQKLYQLLQEKNKIENFNQTKGEISGFEPTLIEPKRGSKKNNEIDRVKSEVNSGIPKKKATSKDISKIESLSPRMKTYLFLCAFLVLTMIWRFYLSYQSEGFLHLGIGLSIMVINIVFIILKVWRP